MIVHQVKYIPPSFVDMTLGELSEKDLSNLPKDIDEIWYTKMEGVAQSGHSAMIVQVILRKKKRYFRHSQGDLKINRPHLSSVKTIGKGKLLTELWRKVPEFLQDDLKHLFAAASEFTATKFREVPKT